MKTKSLCLSILTFVVALSGCATGPTYKEYASQIPVAPPEQGRIYVYRPSAFGAAIQPVIKLDGEVIGRAVPKGFFFVDRKAGNYELSASTEATRRLNLNLQAGEEKYIRLEVKMGLLAGHIKPVLVDQAVGQQELGKTKFIEKKVNNTAEDSSDE